MRITETAIRAIVRTELRKEMNESVPTFSRPFSIDVRRTLSNLIGELSDGTEQEIRDIGLNYDLLARRRAINAGEYLGFISVRGSKVKLTNDGMTFYERNLKK
jgi:hypothetical protein